MRIGIYVAELDIKGGTHKQVLRLCQYLIAKGHSVEIITPTFDLSKTFPEFSEVEVTSIYKTTPRSRFVRLLRYFTPVWLAIKMPKVDVINIHDNRVLFFFFFCWFLKRSRAYVWQINDLHPAFRIGNCAKNPFRWDQPIARVFNRIMARLVDRITVNVGKNVLRVRQHLGAEADLLYCGVDMPRNLPEAKLPIIPPFRVLSTGVFFAYRNYERLIEACALAAQQTDIPIELTIVGDTRYDAAYVRRVKTLADEQSVNLTIRENLTNEEMDHLIESNHVFVFINIDQSWGLAVFESAVRAKPIVLSKSVGASELLNGKAGVVIVDPISLAEISSALVKFSKNPQMCVDFGKGAQESVREMTWDDMYSSKVEAIFKNASQ